MCAGTIGTTNRETVENIKEYMVNGGGSYSRFPGGPRIIYNGCPGGYFREACDAAPARKIKRDGSSASSVEGCALPSTSSAPSLTSLSGISVSVTSLTRDASAVGSSSSMSSTISQSSMAQGSSRPSSTMSWSSASVVRSSSSSGLPSTMDTTPSILVPTTTHVVITTSSSPRPTSGPCNCNEDGCSADSPACCDNGSCTTTCTYL